MIPAPLELWADYSIFGGRVRGVEWDLGTHRFQRAVSMKDRLMTPSTLEAMRTQERRQF